MENYIDQFIIDGNFNEFIEHIKKIEEWKIICSFEYLKEREMKLREIGYACTLKEYHSTNQRKSLTPKLKETIKKRDNYTC